MQKISFKELEKFSKIADLKAIADFTILFEELKGGLKEDDTKDN